MWMFSAPTAYFMSLSRFSTCFSPLLSRFSQLFQFSAYLPRNHAIRFSSFSFFLPYLCPHNTQQRLADVISLTNSYTAIFNFQICKPCHVRRCVFI
nr:MAG TPA: hypothetical protein [Caudoviricetes sp.]